MKAKKSQRIRIENRTLLETVIPLNTPFHIFVDPSAACNFSCKFCFNKDKSKTYHNIMSYEMFEKIINDLKTFPEKLKVLRLYKEGEPLLNKDLPKMIAYAKKMEISETIDFTTNGSMLSSRKNLELINAGLDAINISVQGISEAQYFNISGVKIDFKKYVENIRHLYKNKNNCRVLIKSNDINIPKQDEENFYEIFGDICDEISIEKVVPIWNDVDISDVKTEFDLGIYNQNINDIQVCPYIFYSMAINSDGSVSSCFSDWQHLNIIGNINDESVYDIWNGERLKNLRIAHLKKNRDIYETCKRCNQLKFATIDNIDKYANDILKKIL